MRANVLKGILHSAFAALMVLLISVGAAQAQVALNAKPAMAVLSDGQSVPMWGLFCGAPTATLPTCATLNAHAAAGSWQPPIITVQAGSNLTITLTNSLKVPTSLVIVGQLGGGLGNAPTRTPSPAHAPQTVTWPIGGDGSGPLFTPPAQAARVQSFGTEVAPGATQALTWPAMKAGTYLLESGTHPSIQGPMGLYGVVVVTDTSAAPFVARSVTDSPVSAKRYEGSSVPSSKKSAAKPSRPPGVTGGARSTSPERGTLTVPGANTGNRTASTWKLLSSDS